MSIQLTSGAVRKLEEHEENQSCVLEEPPILQVIRIDDEKKDQGPHGFYHLSLSDEATSFRHR